MNVLKYFSLKVNKVVCQFLCTVNFNIVFVLVCIPQRAPSYYEKLLDVSIVDIYVLVNIYYCSKIFYRINYCTDNFMVNVFYVIY